MAGTYNPAAHTAPETAKAVSGTASVSVVGLSPGRAYVTLNDGRAAAYAWVPTGTTTDGYPGQMVPFPTGTVNVT